MNTRNLKNKIGGALLASSLLLGFASSANAQGQSPWWQNNGGYNQDRRDRDDRYNQGRHRHDRDRDRDRRDDDRDYRRGNNNGQYGDGGYGNNGGYGNGGYANNAYRIAQNQGYQDGLNVGADDAARNQNYNPQRSHYYKDATDGYNSSNGINKGQYRQAFRDGFQQGYDQGYRNNRGYNNNRYPNNNNRYPRSRTRSILGDILGRP